MKSLSILILTSFLVIAHSIQAQDPSAILDLESTTEGILVPRMTESQRDAILNPVEGLMIYQTTSPAGFYFYDGSVWKQVGEDITTSLWQENGVNIYRDTGKVSIGTDNALFDFEISSHAEDESAIMVLRNPSYNQNLLLQSGDIDAEPLISFKGSDALRFGYYDGALHNLMHITSGGNIGIGNENPIEKLEVDGAIRISNSNDPTPDAGTIRWNNATQDFEGFTGSTWKSLTKCKLWGNVVNMETAKINASDAEAYDNFGRSVSISGDYAIVGASGGDDDGSASGSAYIIMRSGSKWSQQAKLIASDAETGDHFGWSVSISGNYAIVGAIGNDSYTGSAYIFMRSDTTWTQQAKLTATDAAANDNFGWSVSISGDYAVVGAHYDDDHGSESGSAYVFMRTDTTWSQQAKLNASDAAAYDYFASSISISGDYAIVGADRDDDGGTSSGSAYVFVRSDTTWSQQAKLNASDAETGDIFGESVSISGNYAIVGASGDDDGGSESGSAYVFMRSDTIWSQQAKLNASDATVWDRFGNSVSISGSYVIVGAVDDDHHGISSGSAYVFMRTDTTWSQQSKLNASDAAAEDLFGESVSISGDHAIVGASGDDDGGSASGSVYIFENE